jgi:RHS repeat-associated protein
VYRPFGEIVSITGSATNNLRFPGQYFLIEDGLHYNWHRQYDPTLGRYTRADPLGFRGGSSLYQYAFSNPLNFIDSTGLNPSFGSCFEECLLQHLGLTSAVAISGVGATPLYKPWLNLPVVGPGASRFTNVLSYIGLKLFPGATVGRQILGSARLFGILGRANIATGSVLLTIDLLQIGLCIDECLDRPDCAR